VPVIARAEPEAISKKGLLRFARNDEEALFSLLPKPQLLKLIADFESINKRYFSHLV
jgi:hypothetical protein